MKKIKQALMVLTMLTAVSILGCSKKEQANTLIDSPQENPVTNNEPIELNITGSVSAAGYVADISKKFPSYKINHIQDTNMVTAVAGGAQFDLVFSSIGEELARLINPGLQYDMTDILKKHNVDLNRFDPAGLDAMKSLTNGKIYGLPVLIDNLVTYYNKDIFDKFAVPYPKDGMTWEEMSDLSKRVTRMDGGKQYLGLVVSSSHYFRTNQFSLPMVDQKSGKSTASSNSEAWKRIYNAVFVNPVSSAGYQEYLLTKTKFPDKNTFLTDGTLAMFIQLNGFFISQSEAISKMNWDMVTLPVYSELPGVGSQVYPLYANLTSTSKHKDEVMEIMKYLTSDEYQLERSKMGGSTSLKNPQVQSAFGTSLNFQSKNYKAIRTLKPAASSIKSEFDDVVTSEFERVIFSLATGTMDINTAIRSVQEAGDKAMVAK